MARELQEHRQTKSEARDLQEEEKVERGDVVDSDDAGDQQEEEGAKGEDDEWWRRDLWRMIRLPCPCPKPQARGGNVSTDERKDKEPRKSGCWCITQPQGSCKKNETKFQNISQKNDIQSMDNDVHTKEDGSQTKKVSKENDVQPMAIPKENVVQLMTIPKENNVQPKTIPKENDMQPEENDVPFQEIPKKNKKQLKKASKKNIRKRNREG